MLGGAIAAVAMTALVVGGTLSLLHTQAALLQTQDALARTHDELADSRRMLLTAIEATRSESRSSIGDVEGRLSQALAKLEASEQTRRRVLQEANPSNRTCLNPESIAVAAMDSCWALSNAFARFKGGDWPDALATLTDLAAQLANKLDVGALDALNAARSAAAHATPWRS